MLKKSAIILLFTMLPFCLVAQQTYRLDVKKSKILWDARKVRGGHYGYIFFKSGILTYSVNGKPVGGIFILDMNSMHSTDHALAADNQKVDSELKTEGFFNMAKYPEASMRIKQISHTAQPTVFNVTGDLTIRDVTNPITFTAIISKRGNTITATGKTAIERTRWHIDFRSKQQSWNLGAAIKNTMIADDIGVSLNLVLNQ